MLMLSQRTMYVLALPGNAESKRLCRSQMIKPDIPLLNTVESQQTRFALFTKVLDDDWISSRRVSKPSLIKS